MNNKLVLSDRLSAVMAMITPKLTVADVGCDHGYLTIELIRRGISPFVIACDVNEGPLQISRNNLYSYEIGDKVDVRLSDGLGEIKSGEVQSIVMAGMGGKLMERILREGISTAAAAREIILQPQSEIAALRRFLMENGFRIISENMVCEDDKFYPIIKAAPGTMDWNREVYIRYGKILLREENPVLHEFLYKEKDYLKNLHAELVAYGDSPNANARIEEVKEHIMINSEALMLMERPGLFEQERVLK